MADTGKQGGDGGKRRKTGGDDRSSDDENPVGPVAIAKAGDVEALRKLPASALIAF